MIKYRTLFEYRSVWMLFAILWIIFLHAPMLVYNDLLLSIKEHGYAGVEIFLFASGIGCYFSLKKDSSIVNFLKRRAWNILPMYFIFLIFYFAFYALTSTVTINEIVGNIFGLGFFSTLDHQFNWYIAAMWVCYLLAPYFVELAQRVPSLRGRFLIVAVMCILAIAFDKEFQLLFWARIPIFFIGIAVAEKSEREETLDIKTGVFWIIGMLLMMVMCYERFWGYTAQYRTLVYYPFIFITLGLCLIISLVCESVSKTPLKKVVDWVKSLGTHTFPMYLTHILIFNIYGYLTIHDIIQSRYRMVALAFLLTIVFSIILTWLEKALKYLLRAL